MDYANSVPGVLSTYPAIHFSMYAWCSQQNQNTYEDTQAYLNRIAALEKLYPGVTFIYMTGNAQSEDSEGYNRYIRNEQIREWVGESDTRVLFDFADLDCWWYNSTTKQWEHSTYDYNGETVPIQHPQFLAPEGPGHTTPESCEQKGKAVWWMMAQLAGWNAPTSTTSTATTSTTSSVLPVSSTSTTTSSPYSTSSIPPVTTTIPNPPPVSTTTTTDIHITTTIDHSSTTTIEASSSTTSTYPGPTTSSTTTPSSLLWPLVYDTMWGAEKDTNLLLMRVFRDEILLKSAFGRLYTSMLYYHSLEILIMLFEDPSLITLTGEVITELLPSIESFLYSDQIVIKKSTVDTIVCLLNRFETNASPQLKTALLKVKEELERGEIFEQLGIQNW